jgi:two-component system, OmpR family, phosphate regulon sensor histidine kinase PhoR
VKRQLALRGAVLALAVAGGSTWLSHVLAGDDASTGTLFLTGALLAMGAGIIGFLVFRQPGETVEQVSAAARAIGEGEMKERVSQASGPAGELAHNFNTMAARLNRVVDQTNAERARVEAVLAATTDAMIAIAADTVVRYMNPAAERLLGVRRNVAVGRPFIESALDYELDALVRTAIDPPRTTESQFVTFGQQRLSLRAVAVPIIDGGDWSVLLILNDLTELQRIDQVRRDFVSNVSHELRTPLASVQALAETMLDDIEAPGEERKEFLERLVKQVERMTVLVNELLDLSRIESGAIRLSPEPLNLGDVIAEAAAMQQARFEQSNITIERPAAIDLTVEADQSSLVRAVSNLLDNAIKYAPPNSTVWVEARDEGDVAAITVRDEGPGIAPHDLPRVFERFYKAEQSRSSSGVGLGLAIVKHLVRAHGGTAEVESPPGGGSVFTLKLPKRFVGTRNDDVIPARSVRVQR